MRRLNSIIAMDKIDRHTLDCIRVAYADEESDQWTDHDLMVRFWTDWKSISTGGIYGDLGWKQSRIWQEKLQGLAFSFEWEAYPQTLCFADWLCENDQEKKAYMKKWWDEKDYPDPWEAYALQTFRALWRISRKLRIDPNKI